MHISFVRKKKSENQYYWQKLLATIKSFPSQRPVTFTYSYKSQRQVVGKISFLYPLLLNKTLPVENSDWHKKGEVIKPPFLKSYSLRFPTYQNFFAASPPEFFLKKRGSFINHGYFISQQKVSHLRSIDVETVHLW